MVVGLLAQVLFRGLSAWNDCLQKHRVFVFDKRYEVHIVLSPDDEHALAGVAAGVRVVHGTEQVATLYVEDNVLEPDAAFSLQLRVLGVVPSEELHSLKGSILCALKAHIGVDAAVPPVCPNAVRRHDDYLPGFIFSTAPKVLLPSGFGTLPQFAFDVLLRPVVAHDAVDEPLASGRVGLAFQDGEIRAADNRFGLGSRHRDLLAILRAASQRISHLLLAPPIVDDPAAVLAQASGIGIAAQHVLIRATNDPIGIFALAIAAALVVGEVAETAVVARLELDAQRRNHVVPILVREISHAG